MKSFCFLAILFSICLLCSSATVLADDKDKPSSDGTWIPTRAELGGNKLPDDVLKTIKLVLEGDKYTVTIGSEVDKGTVKMDAKAKPMTMDIVGTEGPNKGKTILAICEMSGDTMKVCYDVSGKNRPKTFESKPDTLLFLATYKRMKS
jgi:uncharacterized protein (TIGR03067 family)